MKLAYFWYAHKLRKHLSQLCCRKWNASGVTIWPDTWTRISGKKGVSFLRFSKHSILNNVHYVMCKALSGVWVLKVYLAKESIITRGLAGAWEVVCSVLITVYQWLQNLFPQKPKLIVGFWLPSPGYVHACCWGLVLGWRVEDQDVCWRTSLVARIKWRMRKTEPLALF